MPRFEYKVVPAPAKGLKGKGIKGPEARFSHALQELMNGLAGYGWEYLRAETLPSTERAGLTSTTTEWRNVLVFRRLRENDAAAFKPELLPAPMAEEITPAPETEQTDTPTTEQTDTPTDEPTDRWDNGVEDTGQMDNIGPSLTNLAKARTTEKSGD
jgi:hypothetical protein